MRRRLCLAAAVAVLALAAADADAAGSSLFSGRAKASVASHASAEARAGRSSVSPPAFSISLSWGWPFQSQFWSWPYPPPSAVPIEWFYYYVPFAHQPYITNYGYYSSGTYIYPNIIGPPQTWLPRTPILAPAPTMEQEPEEERTALSPFELQPRTSPRLAALGEPAESTERAGWGEPESVVVAARSGFVVQLLHGRRVRLSWSREPDAEAVEFSLLASRGRTLDRAVVRRPPFIAVMDCSYIPLKARARALFADGSSSEITLPLSFSAGRE
jgi:hypothetical protein